MKKSPSGSSENQYLTNNSDLFKNKNWEPSSDIQSKVLKPKNSKQKNKSESVLSLKRRKESVGSSYQETVENSVEEGKKMFEWLLYPLTYEAFLR